jgi:endonuclease/exonuclease/phosphatase family metal-dependent hydrolase
VATGPVDGPVDLRLVSWNIRAGIGPGEPFPPGWWRHVGIDRLERIATFVRGLEPDLVALQEVSIHNADGVVVDEPALLADRTGLRVRYGAVHAYPLVEPETGRAIGAASWGNAILSREPLCDAFVRALPRAEDDHLVEPVGAEHPLAGARYGNVEPGHREWRCAVGGVTREMGVVTAHLTYIVREQRRRQVEGLIAVADDRLATGPLIVAGDLNAAADAAELAPLGARLVDAFAAVGLPSGDPRRRSCGTAAIDHVFVRGLEVLGCRVATEAGDLSDHWPVVVELRTGR